MIYQRANSFNKAEIMSDSSTLEFPCDFPIKALGHSGADFQVLVTELISRHAPDIDLRTLRIRDSRNGRYQSVTLTVYARSRDQLDAIYRDLSSHERVIMAL